MFISPAWAQAAGGGGTDFIVQLFPLVLIFVVFYFLLIRPQQAKVKAQREMLGGVKRGDRVVTGGGIIGLVTKVISDSELQVKLAEGVRVRIIKATMARAGIAGPMACPKGLRHGFGIKAVTSEVPLNMTQKWLGHSRIATTAIYTNATGPEEKQIAERMWL